MKLPRDIGPVHFVGIGGIGMSGIAEVMVNLGYVVQGSDQAEGANVKRLREKGVKIAIGHAAGNLGNAGVVVVSSAIKQDNPELVEARAGRLPVVRRAEMLAELMRLKSCVAIAGTHGKTTTTSMVAALLDAAGFDPTVINGGIINAYGTNARLGAGEWMVVEADEFDGTFLKLPADIAIVTNIDPEHLDHFKSFEAVQDAFRAFVENVPFYGFSVMCTDHPVVQSLVARIEDRRVVTYGENPQADVRLVEVSHAGGTSLFTIALRDRSGQFVREIKNIALPMPGRHNALNATAAIAVAHELGIDDSRIKEALAQFGGVRRRFTRTGMWNGVTIIDDYGHHPVEIAAVLKAAREFDQGPGDRRRAAASLHAAEPLCSSSSAPASTMPTRSSSRMSIRPAKRRSKAPIATRWCKDCARMGIAMSSRSTAPNRLASHVAGMAQAGRLRGLPRRRLDHAMGLCAARRIGGAVKHDRRAPLPETRPHRQFREEYMSKDCLAVRHVAFEDLGLLGPLVASRGYDVRYHDAGVEPIDAQTLGAPDLLIVLGGPIGVYERDAYPFIADEVAAIAARLRANKPMLGICLGAQMMAAALGAGVAPGPVKEIGWAPLTLTGEGRASVLGSARRHAGSALARRQLRVARGLHAARLDAALPGAGFHAHAVAARVAVSSGDGAGALRKLARRPHRRTRQGRHRSARVAHAGARIWAATRDARSKSLLGLARSGGRGGCMSFPDIAADLRSKMPALRGGCCRTSRSPS